MKLIMVELNKLCDDYYKCHNSLLQEQILLDINLLKEALNLLSQENNTSLNQ